LPERSAETKRPRKGGWPRPTQPVPKRNIVTGDFARAQIRPWNQALKGAGTLNVSNTSRFKFNHDKLASCRSKSPLDAVAFAHRVRRFDCTRCEPASLIVWQHRSKLLAMRRL